MGEIRRGGAIGVDVALGEELLRIGEVGLGDAEVDSVAAAVTVLLARPKRTLGVDKEAFFSGISDLTYLAT